MNFVVSFWCDEALGRRDLFADRKPDPYKAAEDQHSMYRSDVEETTFMAAVVAAPLLKSDLNISQRGDCVFLKNQFVFLNKDVVIE